MKTSTSHRSYRTSVKTPKLSWKTPNLNAIKKQKPNTSVKGKTAKLK